MTESTKALPEEVIKRFWDEAVQANPLPEGISDKDRDYIEDIRAAFANGKMSGYNSRNEEVGRLEELIKHACNEGRGNLAYDTIGIKGTISWDQFAKNNNLNP